MQKTILPGRKYGRLTILECVGKSRTNYYFKCRCSCGTETIISGSSLSGGRTRSCGCLNDEKRRERSTTHGHKPSSGATPEYSAYRGMLQRCYDPNVKCFPRWGGRGIKVAPEWIGKGGFERFLNYMGPRPSPQHSIERKRNNGNYEPGNVRWATKAEQARNKRNNWFVLVDGEWINAKDAAPRLKIPYTCLIMAMNGSGPFRPHWPHVDFRRAH